MKRRTLLGGWASGVALRPWAAAAAEPPAPLEVRIVPTVMNEDGTRDFDMSGVGKHFHVVITNGSGRKIRLWPGHCGWGFDNLSFVMREGIGKGKPSHVEKAASMSSANPPAWTVVPPGGQHILDVELQDRSWQGVPPPNENPAEPPRSVLVKAVYRVNADDLSRRLGVWSGEAESPEGTDRLIK